MAALQITQIVVSILLMAAILMQSRGSSIGGVFGGGGGDVFRTKRGAEKLLFRATIVLAVIFMGLAIAGLLITRPGN